MEPPLADPRQSVAHPVLCPTTAGVPLLSGALRHIILPSGLFRSSKEIGFSIVKYFRHH